jgi:heme/copper-type cytochrome/quinol oxidase subunit 2
MNLLFQFSALFCFVSLIVFHTKALNDLRWIENDEKHNQGWSFYILIPAILCFVISGLTTIMAARRFRRDANDRPRAIPYRSWTVYFLPLAIFITYTVMVLSHCQEVKPLRHWTLTLVTSLPATTGSCSWVFFVKK